MNNQSNVTLNNGMTMPKIGLGVWKTPLDQTETAVAGALTHGFHLIDTAKQYNNEQAVGAGLKRAKEAGITRDQVFLTTKIYNGDQGDYDQVRTGFAGQLKKLGTDYVDLLLIHWPVNGKYLATWQALEQIYQDGQAKAIGICNFRRGRLLN